MNRDVEVSIRGGGLSFKGKIDVRTAGEVVAICLSSLAGDDVGVERENNRRSGSREAGLSESPAEYYNRYAPSRNTERILTLASYLKQRSGADSFHSNKIRALFKEVSESMPSNFARDLRKAEIKLGWLERDPSKRKSYRVTGTGLKALENGFQDVPKGGRGKKKAKQVK